MPRFFNTTGPCDPAKHYIAWLLLGLSGCAHRAPVGLVTAPATCRSLQDYAAASGPSVSEQAWEGTTREGVALRGVEARYGPPDAPVVWVEAVGVEVEEQRLTFPGDDAALAWALLRRCTADTPLADVPLPEGAWPPSRRVEVAAVSASGVPVTVRLERGRVSARAEADTSCTLTITEVKQRFQVRRIDVRYTCEG